MKLVFVLKIFGLEIFRLFTLHFVNLYQAYWILIYDCLGISNLSNYAVYVRARMLKHPMMSDSNLGDKPFMTLLPIPYALILNRESLNNDSEVICCILT